MALTKTTSYTVLCSADDPDWLEHRNAGLGGSDMPVVMRAGYKSRLKLWSEKRGLLEPDDLSDNEEVELGNVLEPWVAEKFQRKSGIAIERWAKLLRSNEYPWALATPDYRTPEGHPVQVKTTGAHKYAEWAEGAPPAVYYQIQHELLVTGAPMGYAAVKCYGHPSMWCPVERDEEAITRIIEEGSAFWELVTKGIPPEPSEDDDATIRALHPTAAPGESITLDGDQMLVFLDFKEAKAQASEVDARVKKLQNDLEMALGNAETALWPDGTVAYTWKNEDRYTLGMVDDSKPKDHGEGAIVEAVVKKSSPRVFRPKDAS